MKPTDGQDNLYELIQSMSAAEKGYFKKFAQLFDTGHQNNYILLFDIYNKLPEYDKNKVLKKLKGDKMTRNLPFFKHYLYELVLRSLRSYREGQHVSTRLQNAMQNIDILRSLGLNDQVAPLIIKCKEEAELYDENTRKLQVIHWQRRFILELEAEKIGEATDQLYAEEEEVISRISQESELRRIYIQLFTIVRTNMSPRDPAIRDRLEQIMKHPLLESDQTPLRFYAQVNRLNCRSLYAHLRGEQEKAEYFTKAVVELWNNHPQIRDEHWSTYLFGLGNYMVSVSMREDIAELKKYIDQVEAVQLSDTKTRLIHFEVVTLWKVSYAVLSGDLSSVMQTAADIEKDFDEFGDKVNPATVLIFNYGLVRLYFLAGQNIQALQRINTILDEKKIELRKDLQANTRIYNLILHYEQGNEELLEYLARNTRRYLESRDNYFEFEQIIMQHFNRLLKAENEKNRGLIFTELRTSLLSHMQDHPQEALLLKLTDMMTWLEAKINGITVSQAFALKAR